MPHMDPSPLPRVGDRVCHNFTLQCWRVISVDFERKQMRLVRYDKYYGEYEDVNLDKHGGLCGSWFWPHGSCNCQTCSS